MNLFTFIRFDILAVLTALFVVAISTVKNQRKVWRRAICLLFAIAITFVVIYFNFANIFTIFATYVAAFTLFVCNLLHFTFTKEFSTFVIFLAILLVVYLLYLLLNGIVLLFGGSEKRKYQKYENCNNYFLKLNNMLKLLCYSKCLNKRYKC